MEYLDGLQKRVVEELIRIGIKDKNNKAISNLLSDIIPENKREQAVLGILLKEGMPADLLEQKQSAIFRYKRVLMNEYGISSDMISWGLDTMSVLFTGNHLTTDDKNHGIQLRISEALPWFPKKKEDEINALFRDDSSESAKSRSILIYGGDQKDRRDVFIHIIQAIGFEKEQVIKAHNRMSNGEMAGIINSSHNACCVEQIECLKESVFTEVVVPAITENRILIPLGQEAAVRFLRLDVPHLVYIFETESISGIPEAFLDSLDYVCKIPSPGIEERKLYVQHLLETERIFMPSEMIEQIVAMDIRNVDLEKLVKRISVVQKYGEGSDIQRIVDGFIGDCGDMRKKR